MALEMGYKALLAEADKSIRTLSVDEARALLDSNDVQFVDLRDVRELQREGKIPGAFHAPRGMLEFWVDPESPYYKDVFGSGKTFVFYCQSGWRSALATYAVQRMGLKNVCHIGGGYRAWADAGAATEEVSAHR
ncbi:MAG: rhodanese-like domain-containing protein [Pseudomonadales bacterium]